MKIVSYDVRHGILKVVPDDVDDLWTLYNVIRQEDTVHAKTTREVKIEDDEESRVTKGKRVTISVSLKVKKVTFQSESDRLRISGFIIEAPEKYSLLGNHHTINLGLNQEITITKVEWQKYDLDQVKRATEERGQTIIILGIDDDGGAVAILRQHGLLIKGEIRARLPGKLEIERREGAVNQYYAALFKILEEVWLQKHGLIVIVGPGFWKETFARYVRDQRSEIGESIVTVAMASSGGVSGIEEALRSGVLRKVAEKSRIISETELVDNVLARLGGQRGDVSYGLDGAKKAIGYGAVEEILVLDTFLRESEDEARRSVEGMMREVEKMGGKVSIISGEHEGGRKLLGLGGVAALLRFRIE